MFRLKICSTPLLNIGKPRVQRFDSDTVLLTDNPYLINAAQRNYHIFKTPTSFVNSTKVKRFYTPEQQADLDIKTSVNKIGEIVNLSQELNSLLWDRMYGGETYDNIKDLYYDICQLDVMSGIEIDKAKKEFVIDNCKELEKLRQKYEGVLREYEEDDRGNLIRGKKRMPYFFSHVSRQKGYYNPEKKHYCKYHTTMDYIQTIVNGFKIKNPYMKDWLPFVSILDSTSYRTSNVNQKQINKIYSLLKKYINERNNIYACESDTKESKNEKAAKLKIDLITDINSETLGFSTLYRLLSSIECKENSKIKKLLLEILYLCGNESFNKAIYCSIKDIKQIEYGGNDLKIFNLGFKITKKRANSEIEPYLQRINF